MSEDSPLEFPCEFPIKVFGRNEKAFREAVLSIMRDHFEDLAETDVAERPSREENYLSLTVVVRAESRAQLDAVFEELTSHEAVIMVL